MKKLFFTLIMIFSLCSNYAAADELTAHQFLEISSNNILTVMNGHKEAGVTDVDVLSASLEDLLEQVVDFKSIAKAVMGKHRKKLTPEQKQEFTSVFKKTLVQLYTKVFVQFEIVRIDVEPPIKDLPFKGSVAMKVTASDGAIYSISYSVRKNKEQQWMVRNVILDGINLGLAYRNQFDSAYVQHGGDMTKVLYSWAADVSDDDEVANAKVAS